MKNNFNQDEKKLIAGMSMVILVRMLGASMILPVFSIYATGIEGATAMLGGVAMGIFGISQMLFQVPLGKLSDRWGRKETTILGFCIFFIGSVLSGLSTNITELIISRFIAGAGAVAGVTMAWLTDGVHTDRRNFAVAFVGISYGASAILGLSLSPLIAWKWNYGPESIFYLCAGLTIIAIVFISIFLRNNAIPEKVFEEEGIHLNKNNLMHILKRPGLIRLNICGFIANLTFISVFFTMPLLIKQAIGVKEMWKILTPAAIFGTALMFIFARQADKKGPVITGIIGFTLELIGVAVPIFTANIIFLFLSFLLVYSGHCVLSPILPVAVSHFPGNSLKGTVMSVFTSSQFLGVGIGGALSGFLYELSPEYLFIVLFVLLSGAVFSIYGFKAFNQN